MVEGFGSWFFVQFPLREHSSWRQVPSPSPYTGGSASTTGIPAGGVK
jgi:hypothetical protein